MNTPRGPSSETANLMVKPPIPAIVKPPSTPMKNTLSCTGVVVSKLSISCPLASSLTMPPMSPAVIRPPNMLPFNCTPIEAMSMIGNLPCSRRPTSILTPSMAPENSSPAMPCRPVTAADKVSTKSAGSSWMSRQVMPISVILIGSHDGHLKLAPSAAPIERNTPKPGLVTKVPSPRKAKLRPSPPMTSEPMVTSAPTERKLTISSVAAAEVLMKRSVAVSVTNEPSLMRMVSARKMKPLTRPSSNSRPKRMASVFGTPGAMSGSPDRRSEMMADTGLPGRKRAPPEATKMVPLNTTAWPKVTLKLVTPTRRSSNSRMPAMPILPVPPPDCCRLEPAPPPGL